MSYVSLRQAIEARFNTNWTFTPIQWPNKDFDPNESRYVGTFDIGGNWVRLAINTNEPDQVSVGGTPLKRVYGIISVSVFVPFNTGTGSADSLVDSVASIFEDQSFGGVVCRTTERRVIGKTESWYQVNANTMFNFDYT